MTAAGSASRGFEAPHVRSGWLLALGVAQIILGIIALGDTLLVTLVSVLLLGWLLIGSAIIHLMHMLRHTEARSFWNFATIVLDLLAGIFLIIHPAFGALTLTL